MAATAGNDGTVRIWDLTEGRHLRIPLNGCYGLALHHSALLVATHLGVCVLDLLAPP